MYDDVLFDRNQYVMIFELLKVLINKRKSSSLITQPDLIESMESNYGNTI